MCTERPSARVRRRRPARTRARSSSLSPAWGVTSAARASENSGRFPKRWQAQADLVHALLVGRILTLHEYNNALARLRRLSGSFEEASADLGADSWQTFRHVTFPELRTPLLA